MITIETGRLTLRNFRPDDWQDLQEVTVQYQASDSAKYEPPSPTSAEEIQGIARWFAAGDDYLAVCLKATGRVIGLIAIERRKDREEQVHNLGYVFHPAYWGHGYATEGCRAAMDYIFRRLGAVAIVTGTNPANEPSVRLLNRLGLKSIGQGEYAISKEEWLGLGQASV